MALIEGLVGPRKESIRENNVFEGQNSKYERTRDLIKIFDAIGLWYG